ncbi:tautomerase family protein [Methylobacterium radiodurans]|uniref:Tautomerase family protein n=1 Tax=Methylobacterium radiodurans TaxID=2202828 RepID=A0A2U8VNV7_9HYPH|nr:tautomerase family protein [Methylobacterium radiodurans]AWN35314.1 tautomerase family protein [Methylobacterium radiodurans]
MPLIRISLRAGKPAAYRAALGEGVYAALRETFGVPEDDRFVMIHEHEVENFAYGAGYLGIARSDDLVIVQITCNDTRSLAQKRALYRRIVDTLVGDPGLRAEDVLINLVEVKTENWSFGNGLAQYADPA